MSDAYIVSAVRTPVVAVDLEEAVAENEEGSSKRPGGSKVIQSGSRTPGGRRTGQQVIAQHLGTATTCCLMMMMTMMRVVYLGRTLTQFLQTTSASFHSFALHLPPPSTCSDGQAVSMGDASVCRINPRTHSCPRRHWQMVAFFWNECETVCTLSRSKHGHKGKADR